MLGRSSKFCLDVQKKLCQKYVKINNNFRQVSSSLQLDVSLEDIQSSANKYFPQFAKDLTEHSICQYFPELKMKLIRLIDYPSHVGEKQIPCTTLMCYKALETGEITEENVNLVYLLGWLGEMLQSIIYISGDIINDIEIRNNYITYHNLADAGLLVANDTILLQNCIYSLITQYFRNHPNYRLFFELFHDVGIESSRGLNLEMISKDFKAFSMDLIERIAKHKIASVCYRLPLLSALYVTGAKDVCNLAQTKEIFNDIAAYRKVENDFMDSFSQKPKHINIQNGYCSWLAVSALEKGNDNQKEIIKENYAKKEDAAIDQISSLYNELNLPLEFENFKIKKMTDIRNKIDNLQNQLLKECIVNVIDQNKVNL